MKNKDNLVNQRENHDFLKSALTLKGSITPKILHKVIMVVIYSVLVSCLNYYYPEIILPIGPFEYGGFIMGLLLVFRINAGYDRWWEARKLWGSIVNLSRNLTIIILNYSNPKHRDWEHKITNYIAALPYLIKNSLRFNNDIETLSPLLDASSYSQLARAENKPVILTSLIANELQIARNNNSLNEFAFIQAEDKRAQLIDAYGACERILKTPMPFVMAVKSRLYILIFLLMLPFALVGVSLWINPVITGLVAYALFALDQIGVELQNPFSEYSLSHLPLTDICRTIEKNVKELSNR